MNFTLIDNHCWFLLKNVIDRIHFLDFPEKDTVNVYLYLVINNSCVRCGVWGNPSTLSSGGSFQYLWTKGFLRVIWKDVHCQHLLIHIPRACGRCFSPFTWPGLFPAFFVQKAMFLIFLTLNGRLLNQNALRFVRLFYRRWAYRGNRDRLVQAAKVMCGRYKIRTCDPLLVRQVL